MTPKSPAVESPTERDIAMPGKPWPCLYTRSGPAVTGLHSSTFQLNLSRF